MPIAFKEWAVTVRALAEGEQLVTLRKGGIREENKHFEIEHDRFFLYPTFEHRRNDVVRASAEERGTSVATVTTISYLGFLCGPPLVGLVSGALDLRAGIALLAGIAVVTSVAASTLGDALSLRRQGQPAGAERPLA